ncbi:MAG: hypothetical protein ACFFDS_01660 [Candidatus Thorarchaeota archaeon]
MSVALHNFLKSQDPKEFSLRIKDQKQFQNILTKLKLDKNLSKDNFVELMLRETKVLFNSEKRKEGMIILKAAKALLPQVSKKIHATFYLRLGDSFLLANDFEAAKKAVNKAYSIANNENIPYLEVKALNLLFIIHRTIGKEKAMDYLLKSKEIATQNNFYEDLVFCDVNIGLMHFFKKEINKAFDSCKNIVENISENPYPDNKILMPADYILQLFSDNPGLVAVSKNHETILKGIKIILRAIKALENDYEATRRISILTSFLKLSDKLIESSLTEIDSYIENLNNNQKALYYSAIANGIIGYNESLDTLKYFEKALKFTKYLSDEAHRKVRKGYAYTLSNLIGISMIYDLETSSQTSQRMKNLNIKTSLPTILGDKNANILYRNAVNDSDAAFAISKQFLEENLLATLKELCVVKKIISNFTYQNSRKNILEHLEVFCINILTFEDEVISLLFVGTTMSEKDLKKKRKIFSGYQILGHILPKTLDSEKHVEDFDVQLIYDLLKSPRKFQQIELITNSDELELDFKSTF